MKPSSVAIMAVWAVTALTALQPAVAAASSVGPYGVSRVTMVEPYIGGRPVTFSDADIFACIDRGGRGEVYRVPYRYVTDQTSIPPDLVRFLVGRGLNPLFSNAAIVHDYFYAVGKPGNIALQKRADEDLITLMRSEEVDEGTLRKVRLAFNALRSPPFKNPFGAAREWSRWADPTTLTYARDRPVRPHDVTPVVALASCHVFDSVTALPQQNSLLHACLHHRYMSTLTVELWPPLVPPRTPPSIPAPLRSHSTRIAEFMAGDCTQFG